MRTQLFTRLPCESCGLDPFFSLDSHQGVAINVRFACKIACLNFMEDQERSWSVARKKSECTLVTRFLNANSQ